MRRRISGCRIVLTKPLPQWHVSIHRIVNAVGRQTVAEDLSPNRVKAGVQMLYRHGVFGSKPAITVTEPNHFARHLRRVRAAGMPSATVQQHGGTGRYANWFGAVRAGSAILGAIEFIPAVRARYNH